MYKRQVKDKQVWDKIPRAEAKSNGWKVLKARWIDINKGDDESPNYRSRLVAKEINQDSSKDSFAAAPPLVPQRPHSSVQVVTI